MKSIQAKLTVMILVIFFCALSVLGGLNYWKTQQIILENLHHDLADTAEKSANTVSDWLETRKAEITMLAVAPVVQSGNQEAILPFLVNAVKVNNAYDSIGYITPTGAYFNSSGATGSLADRDYFQRAMKGEASVSDPLISRSTGRLVTVVAVPVQVDGKVTGVLYGAVDMAGLDKNVLEVKAGQTGYAYVLQKDGLIIIHPDKEKVMKGNALSDNKFPPPLRAVSEHMVKGETGISRYEYAGVDKMVAYAPVPGMNWSLAVTVPVAEFTGEVKALMIISLGTMAVVLLITGIFIAWYARCMARPIQELEMAAKRIAEGEINVIEIKVISQDELGRLARAFETMVVNLRGVVLQISESAHQVAASAEQLTANAEQSAQAAGQVAESITDTAQGVESQVQVVDNALLLVQDITTQAQQEAANTLNAVNIVGRAVSAAREGNQAVDTVITQMSSIRQTVDNSAKVVAELGERSNEIGVIVETISNIAGQTNLLALNAAIEAARAGEQGRGFAVVAEEVRKLAEQSEEAAKRIAGLICNIQGRTEQAVAAMAEGTQEVRRGTEVVDQAGRSFREIDGHVQEVAEIARGVADGLNRLVSGSQQVLVAMQETEGISRDISGQTETISAATEEQSAATEEIASSSQHLAQLAEQLQTVVAKFKI